MMLSVQEMDIKSIEDAANLLISLTKKRKLEESYESSEEYSSNESSEGEHSDGEEEVSYDDNYRSSTSSSTNNNNNNNISRVKNENTKKRKTKPFNSGDSGNYLVQITNRKGFEENTLLTNILNIEIDWREEKTIYMIIDIKFRDETVQQITTHIESSDGKLQSCKRFRNSVETFYEQTSRKGGKSQNELSQAEICFQFTDSSFTRAYSKKVKVEKSKNNRGGSKPHGFVDITDSLIGKMAFSSNPYPTEE
ncbi:predicted protein [Naegleria gruberi]|uniref:Predicted protein n=1 Tax=Naegleria gruberi TaxID=5762 RepID=D2VXY3_NAEGR|nr:uncharacterized protein NAEGRDRAFT_74001 [Naegleria gruberi]EFC38318.1 predicted protein [Naegleria gruberi]|eukprot:XP_002671062.1 predicted protein [Naegleria gruberi strain NEG-M]